MKMIIQTPDFKATRKLEKFINSHLAKLAVIDGDVIEARVCLKTDKSDTNENKVCEIKLGIPGNDLYASKQSKTFEEAVVKTINALRHQADHLKTLHGKQRRSAGIA
jgi:putative sigma-54 modulation protein